MSKKRKRKVVSQENLNEEKDGEIMSLDVDAHPVEPGMYTAETALGLLNDALEDEYQDDVQTYAESEEMAAALTERQTLHHGQTDLTEMRKAHHAQSPTLSGGDVDAAWEQANAAGSETVGGTAVTPGQNDLDAMGEAMGITQDRNEPLNISKKRRQKDEDRWELNPASAEETE